MALKISFANQKGGVGKSNLLFHTSGVLSEMGKKVLCIDVDPQGTLSTAFMGIGFHEIEKTIIDILREESDGIENIIKPTEFKNIHIIPASQKLHGLDIEAARDHDIPVYLAEELANINDYYDYILIDTPANLGMSTRIALLASDYTIIPVMCLGETIDVLDEIVDFIKKVQARANPRLDLLGMVVNMLDIKRTSTEQTIKDMLNKKYSGAVLRTEFRRRLHFADSYSVGKPINYYKPTSEEADTARTFVKEIITYVQTR